MAILVSIPQASPRYKIRFNSQQRYRRWDKQHFVHRQLPPDRFGDLQVTVMYGIECTPKYTHDGAGIRFVDDDCSRDFRVAHYRRQVR